jgi:hypothetical protein
VLGQDVGGLATETLLTAAQSAARTLADSAVRSLSVKTVLAAGTPVLNVVNAQQDRVVAATTTALTRLGWGGMTVTLTQSDLPLSRRLVAGQVAGSVTGSISSGSGSVTTQIVARTTMPSVGTGWKLRHFF